MGEQRERGRFAGWRIEWRRQLCEGGKIRQEIQEEVVTRFHLYWSAQYVMDSSGRRRKAARQATTSNPTRSFLSAPLFISSLASPQSKHLLALSLALALAL